MNLRTSTICILLFALSGCKEPIIHDVSEREANSIITALHLRSLDASKDKQADGRWSIVVPAKDELRALGILEEERLVKGVEDDINKQSSLMTSKEDQRYQFERSLSKDIEKTFDRVEGVRESRVHLNLPPRDPIFGRVRKGENGSASVLLVVDENYRLESDEASKLVSGASGIDMQFVSVLVNKENFSVQSFPTTEKTLIPYEMKSLLSYLMLTLVASGAGTTLILQRLGYRRKRDETEISFIKEDEWIKDSIKEE